MSRVFGGTMFLHWILPVILLFALSFLKGEGVQSTSDRSSCKPLRILFFWHTSRGEDKSFFQQRRLIIRLIKYVPVGSGIYLSTVDTSLKSLIYFRKDSADTTQNWVDKIGFHKPGHSVSQIIPYVELKKAVYGFLYRLGDQTIAEKIVLVVNKKSIFDHEEQVKETLKNQQTVIVYSGTNQSTSISADLAIDTQHLVVLNDSGDDNVTDVAESILNFLCKDSRVRCDTDEYWNGKRCFRCSFICSRDSKDPSENCLKHCPYYGKRTSTDAKTADHDVVDSNGHFVLKNLNLPEWAIVFTCICLGLLTFGGILFISVAFYRKVIIPRSRKWQIIHKMRPKLQSLNNKNDEYEMRSPLVDIDLFQI